MNLLTRCALSFEINLNDEDSLHFWGKNAQWFSEAAEKKEKNSLMYKACKKIPQQLYTSVSAQS